VEGHQVVRLRHIGPCWPQTSPGRIEVYLHIFAGT
jgi:hypothetical protein